MVESSSFLHTSSHPDKYNNSANRIISKEEEREDIQGEILQSSSTVFPHTIHPFYKNYSVSTCNPATPSFHKLILHTELILPQEILQLQGSSHADQYKASSSDCPHASKHSTWQNKAPGSPTAFQAHMAQADFQLIVPSRNSILNGSQPPHSPYSSSQASSIGIHLVLQNSTGEIGFISKGSSIVYLCNTKVSVFQCTYQNNSTRILILSRVLIILCEDTVRYLQSKLS